MRGAVEALAFVGLAFGLHLGGLAAVQRDTPGPVGPGADGTARVSIVGSSEPLAALIAAWDRPPETPATPVAFPVPEPDRTAAPPAALASGKTRPTAPVLRAPTMARSPPEAPTSRTLSPKTVTPPRAPAAADADAAAIPPAAPRTTVAAPRPRTLQPPGEANRADAPPKVQPPPDPPAPVTPPLSPSRAPSPVPQADQGPAQRAMGAGNGSAAGGAEQAPDAIPDSGTRDRLMARWGGQIRAEVERRKRYPRAAGRAVGTATVLIRVAPDGRVVRAALTRSAGHPALDHAALDAVRAAHRFVPAPAGLSAAGYDFIFRMNFAR